MLTSDKQAILIFELGSLQVLCYQTMAEWSAGVQAKEVFWQKLPECQIKGPFPSIFAATADYTRTYRLMQLPSTTNNVIHIDFKTKKRLT